MANLQDSHMNSGHKDPECEVRNLKVGILNKWLADRATEKATTSGVTDSQWCRLYWILLRQNLHKEEDILARIKKLHRQRAAMEKAVAEVAATEGITDSQWYQILLRHNLHKEEDILAYIKKLYKQRVVME